jgi:class 3 adenylate cyclase/YHS domain-containing protein
MTDRLSIDELAQRSGAPVETLREWQARGLIGLPTGTGFDRADVRRARFIRRLLRRGVSVEALAETERAGSALGRSLDFLAEPSGPVYSLAQAAERSGHDAKVLERLIQAAGIAADEPLFDDDLERFRAMRSMLEAGLPEEALIQLLRVYDEALGRVADAEARLFHFYVHERMRAQGMATAELANATEAARLRMLPVVEPTILYFHRKGFARAVEDDALLHLQEDIGVAVPGQLRLAVAFVDLASFTPLADSMGDSAAAQVLARFSQIVHEAAASSGGRIVKQIGDAFMLIFSRAPAAITCVAEIERLAALEPKFPAVRAGIQWGTVLYRDGEYLGVNVNVAARLAAVAERNQVLATAAVKDEAGAIPGAEFASLGLRTLKGIAEEIDIFAVHASSATGGVPRLVDPVCGLELQPGAEAARLVLDGEEQFFCCATCLQRFVEERGKRIGRDPDDA